LQHSLISFPNLLRYFLMTVGTILLLREFFSRK
jgi:hypothetical protein